ncbi:hypothetical protein B296_00002583, partial [Ensete ventricosum]
MTGSTCFDDGRSKSARLFEQQPPIRPISRLTREAQDGRSTSFADCLRDHEQPTPQTIQSKPKRWQAEKAGLAPKIPGSRCGRPLWPHKKKKKKKRRRRGRERGGEMGPARDSKAPKRDGSNRVGSLGGAEGPEARPAFTVDGADEDECLRRSDVLSREEVLRRRARRLKQLAGCHSRQYWALMEEVRVKHRDYYWEHGVSPYEEGEEDGDGGGGRGREAGENGGAVEGREENRMAGVGVGLGLGFRKGEGSGGRRGERSRCAFAGCKSKAMPLTRFCHPHILADRKQTLYKACSYVTR